MNTRPTSDKTKSLAANTETPIQELLAKGLVWKGDPLANQQPSNWHDIHLSQTLAIPFDVPEIDSILPAGGLQRGAVHEFFYHDPTGIQSLPCALPAALVTRAINSHQNPNSTGWEAACSNQANLLAVWIGKKSWPTPFSLPHGSLKSCIFIDPPTDKLTLWAIETALRSNAVNLVVSECPKISLTTTRRFAHAAKEHNTTAILLRSKKDLQMPSSAATRWLISPTPSETSYPLWRLSLEKIKGGAPSVRSWTIGLENRYEEREEISVCVFPGMVDRCNEEEPRHKKFGT